MRPGCRGVGGRRRGRPALAFKTLPGRADFPHMDDRRLAALTDQAPQVTNPTLGLTRRELQVLQLVADGMANRQVGEALFVSEDTVKTHVRHVLAKLNATSRANAVAIGIRARLIR